MSIMELKDVTFSYYEQKKVLQGVNMRLEEGKMHVIFGPSGCGKTTLLSLMGGLDLPGGGAILFRGRDVYREIGLTPHRRHNVSFVFQNYNLIEYMTPAENVSLTSKKPPLPFLQQVGLTDEESQRNVLKLSGGQQQRTAIARALASEAPMILADEPTGNLDDDTAGEITKILKDNAIRLGKCVVVVSHSKTVAAQADVLFEMKDGLVRASDGIAESKE